MTNHRPGESKKAPLSLEELNPILRCPKSGAPLNLSDQGLQSSEHFYQYFPGTKIPDLRVAPDRLLIDSKWYEPWDDLDEVLIEYPESIKEPGLPYHLDQYLAGMVPGHGDGRWLLEIGCGERQCESWMNQRDFNYVGLDVDVRGPGPNILADGHNLPLSDECVDYCASMAVLEHVVSPITFCNEVFRVLRPGGVFFGSAAFMYGFHDRASFHHMSHAGLLYVLRVAGFKVERLWPDWRYPDAISTWPFRGAIGMPWRALTRSVLELSEWSFTRLSNATRKLAGKAEIDLIRRDIEMAGSVSFRAVKPG